MYYKKNLIVAALLFAAFILPGAVVKTQPNVPTINVDTLVNLGKYVPGEACGAFFLPDGNIIAVKGDTPYIIDSKSGEILRTLESCKSETVINPKVSKDGKRFIAGKMGPKYPIWDVPTGKILITLENVNAYCFSPDGSKLYILGGNSSGLGAIRVLDMNTLLEIERFGDFSSGHQIDISPDGQTIVAYVTKEHNQSDPITSQIVQINMSDKKNYTVIETMEPGIKSLEFSPDGKRIASLYEDGNQMYIYIYNLETKEKEYIRREELEIMFGVAYIAGIGKPQFIDNEIIYTGIGGLQSSFSYNFTWNIAEHKVKNYINFEPSILDVKDSLILFCGGRYIGLSNKNAVTVEELNESNENYLVFNNNQLEFYSDKAFIGTPMVYDTTGKMIANLGSQTFVPGKNTIPINQTLNIGIYILTINTGSEQFSYKFIVEYK